MKNSKLRAIYTVLMLLPFAVAAAALQILPDNIPVHYNIDGQADRFGSKYEMLIMPVVNVLMGLFMLGMARLAKKNEKSGNNNERITLITGACTLLLFNFLTCFFLYTAYENVTALSDTTDFLSVEFGIIGLILIIIGNYMPKLRMNGTIGFRTSWTMKNETIWKKSQRLAGISFIIAGALIFVVSLFTEEWLCAGLSAAVFFGTLIADMIVSYRMSFNN